jgi:hypothetical protein
MAVFAAARTLGDAEIATGVLWPLLVFLDGALDLAKVIQITKSPTG